MNYHHIPLNALSASSPTLSISSRIKIFIMAPGGIYHVVQTQFFRRSPSYSLQWICYLAMPKQLLFSKYIKVHHDIIILHKLCVLPEVASPAFLAGKLILFLQKSFQYPSDHFLNSAVLQFSPLPFTSNSICTLEFNCLSHCLISFLMLTFLKVDHSEGVVVGLFGPIGSHYIQKILSKYPLQRRNHLSSN